MSAHIVSAVPFNVASALGGRSTLWIFILSAFAFGLSGGLAGVLKKLDFFGVIVLAGVVGLTGGALRDVFLGIPAMAIFDWRLLTAVVLAGCTAYVFHGPLLRLHYPIQVLDGIGLSLVSVIGTDISLVHHATPWGAALLGVATGIGGGVIRDVVLTEVPQVFHSGLYAVPSLVGSATVVVGYELKVLNLWWCAMAAAICLGLRLAGIFLDLNLPRATYDA